MVILAERRTFSKVISGVWNEAVDEAARLGALELDEIDPGVADALSEAAFCLARSRIMDDLIDQCAIDLTGPKGELWPDARAMTAVADGLGYQVRSQVMSELIDAAVAELSDSGEAELLMSEAAAAQSSSQESGGGEEEHEDTWDDGQVPADADGALVDSRSGKVPAHETQQGVTVTEASSTTALSADTTSALAGVDETHQPGGSGGGGREHSLSEEPRQSDQEWMDNGTMTETGAAILLQSVLRRKAVYRDMKALVARNFIRLYDPNQGAFYW